MATLTIDHIDSPLHELRELGGWRDDFQARFPAAVIDPSVQRPVGATASLTLGEHPIAWYAVALDAVVLDGTAFAPLRRVDPTRMAAAERAVVGRVTAKARQALGTRGVIEFLMRIGAIQTYWHKGANLCLKAEMGSESGGEKVYRSDWQAVHHYETNTRTEAQYAFVVEFDAGGEVVVIGAGEP
ncbi:MAG: hypothetical protein AAGF11_21165 [Myxococcota bacterium]